MDIFVILIIAIVSFLLTYLVFDIGLIFSIIVSAGVFVGIFLIFGKKEEIYLAEGVTEGKLKEILYQGRLKQETLKGYLKKINNNKIKEKIEAIIDVVERIFDDLKKDPKDVKVARQFLNYYLDSTINILERYYTISSSNAKLGEMNKVLEKVESMLDTIKDAFEKQLAKLLNDDILDLDTEIKVLEQMIKSDGLN